MTPSRLRVVCLEQEGSSYNFGDYKKEDFLAMGINDSSVHVDFMIGSEDLQITGVTENGERVCVFEQGNWAL